MPTGTHHRKITQRARIRAKARANKQATRRKAGNGSKADAARIIADSVFALTLKPKPAVIVKQLIRIDSSRYSKQDDYEKMYQDVMQVVHNAVYLVTGEVTSFNPYASGFGLSESFDIILNIFKRDVLPNGWEFNIEKEDNHSIYHIAMYKVCEMQCFWHVFELKHVLKYWRKKNPELHDMFLLFMYNFCHHTQIMTWYNGALGYVEPELLMERLQEFEFDTEEEQYQKEAEVQAVIDSYEKGEVHEYEEMMKAQYPEPVESLRSMLSYFPRRNKLVRWMLDACTLMEAPVGINDFIYAEMVEERGEGVMFDMQMGVIWDVTDPFTCEQEEYLDAESQGCGIHEPILTIRLFSDIERLSIKEIEACKTWPQQLTKIYQQYIKVVAKYERPNRVANKQL